MSQYLPEEEEAKIYLQRYILLRWIVVFSVTVLIIRLWYLQIIEGQELADFSMRNRVKETRIPAPRGLILDRDERVLVDNLPGFEVTITPQYASELEETAKYVGGILGIPSNAIVTKVKTGRKKNGPFRPVQIKDHLSRDELFRLMLKRFDHPGLEIRETIVRGYPLKENGAQLFGYVGEISKEQIPEYNAGRTLRERLQQGDVIGQTGIEKYLDDTIRGVDGASFMQVDARGREARSSTLRLLEAIERTQEAVPGQSVVLTIDRDVQEAAYKAMQGQPDKIGPRIGALVAIRPNGEVVAWANSPSYDPNEFSTGISPDIWKVLVNDPFQPLRNKVIQDHTPPGSTFKAIVALAALQEKLITPNTSYFCGGSLKFGRRAYHCWAEHGHGNVNLLEAIERSCDVFFYRVGMALGIDRIAKYAKALGLGDLTNIDTVGEVTGIIPTEEWKERRFGEAWQPGETLSNAIGQGFVLATPLQMAVAFSTIANEGGLYRPFLLKKILDQRSRETPLNNPHGPTLIRDLSTINPSQVVIDPENFRLVKEGLRRVSNGASGTARYWKIPGVEIAGKSGTVQLRSYAANEIFTKCDSRPLSHRHHGWFVGYAPAQNPVITVAMLAQHSCSGSSGAGPIVRDVIRAYIEKYHPEMIERKPSQKIIAPQPQPQLEPGLQGDED